MFQLFKEFYPQQCVLRYVSGSVLLAAYGYKVKAQDDHYVGLVHKAIQPLLRVIHAGSYLVEFIPWLKHIPGELS